MSEQKWSQVSCIGEPRPKSWDDFRKGCMNTFAGGHHHDGQLEAFRHGMNTVFNLLVNEFPSAELCRAAPYLLEACKSILQNCIYESRGVAGWHLNGDLAEWDSAFSEEVKLLEKAIGKAEGQS